MFVLFYDNVFFVGVCGVWVDVWFWCVRVLVCDVWLCGVGVSCWGCGVWCCCVMCGVWCVMFVLVCGVRVVLMCF